MLTFAASRPKQCSRTISPETRAMRTREFPLPGRRPERIFADIEEDDPMICRPSGRSPEAEGAEVARRNFECPSGQPNSVAAAQIAFKLVHHLRCGRAADARQLTLRPKMGGRPWQRSRAAVHLIDLLNEGNPADLFFCLSKQPRSFRKRIFGFLSSLRSWRRLVQRDFVVDPSLEGKSSNEKSTAPAPRCRLILSNTFLHQPGKVGEFAISTPQPPRLQGQQLTVLKRLGRGRPRLALSTEKFSEIISPCEGRPDSCFPRYFEEKSEPVLLNDEHRTGRLTLLNDHLAFGELNRFQSCQQGEARAGQPPKLLY